MSIALVEQKLHEIPECYMGEIMEFLLKIQKREELSDKAGGAENARKKNRSRMPGTLKGKFWMSPDFDEPLEDFSE